MLPGKMADDKYLNKNDEGPGFRNISPGLPGSDMSIPDTLNIYIIKGTDSKIRHVRFTLKCFLSMKIWSFSIAVPPQFKSDLYAEK